MNDTVILIFIFAFGACVGSFLNVVVYRLPRGQSLIFPPSRCPKCEHFLAWYDNVPVLGWIWLGGKCRYCRAPISPRYPIVEAVTGAIFVAYYILFFDMHVGPCATPPRVLNVKQDWPIFALCMYMLATLLAASLIDAELFIIPSVMCWLMAGIGVATHAVVAMSPGPGRLIVDANIGAMALGALVGWLISLLLVHRSIIKTSFVDGEPMQDVDREAAEQEIAAARARGENPAPLPPVYSKTQLCAELVKEMLFLLPPMILSAAFFIAVLAVPALGEPWKRAMSLAPVAGAMGSIFGAMVGALVVWVTRILGSLGFGRLAMGLGDVNLMFGVGAIVGAGPVTVAFFLAPFAGMALALYLLAFGKRREIPYGPYLSLGVAATLLFYCPIAQWLGPGLSGLGQAIRGLVSGSS